MTNVVSVVFNFWRFWSPVDRTLLLYYKHYQHRYPFIKPVDFVRFTTASPHWPHRLITGHVVTTIAFHGAAAQPQAPPFNRLHRLQRHVPSQRVTRHGRTSIYDGKGHRGATRASAEAPTLLYLVKAETEKPELSAAVCGAVWSRKQPPPTSCQRSNWRAPTTGVEELVEELVLRENIAIDRTDRQNAEQCIQLDGGKQQKQIILLNSAIAV